VSLGRKRELTGETVEEIRAWCESGETVPAIIKRTNPQGEYLSSALAKSELVVEIQ
jgi:hypothetical protein